MILTCPQCATRYNADDSKFPREGRNVRCAKCGHVWHQAGPQPEITEFLNAPDPEPAAPQPEHPVFTEPPPTDAPAPRQAFVPKPEPEPGHGDDDESAVKPPKKRAPIGAIAGWGALVLTVLIIGWAAANFRENIARIWPQTASLYQALGMDVNPRGLAFTDVAYHRETQDGEPVLAVTGKLVNVGTSAMSVPEIVVALSDGQKRELYHWSFSASVSMLKPGEAVPFLTRLSSPPAGAKHLEVRLAGE